MIQAKWRTLLVGGLLPVLAFTVVEIFYGPKAGLIAGIVFGLGELSYEYFILGQVQRLTLGSNALILILGSLALMEENSVLFKLQPAIVFLILAVVIIGSSFLGKPLMVALLLKQRPDTPKELIEHMRGLNLRLGVCLFVIGLISIYSAFYWTTAAWAAFKAFGAPLLMVLYIILDVGFVRWRKLRRSGRG